MSRLFLRGFRRPWHVASRALGDLEKEVLAELWRRRGPVTVREVASHFPALAYTTLQTTLDRLHRKGFLARERQGRAHAYRPVAPQGDLEVAIATDIIQGLVGDTDASRLRPVMSCFVDSLGARDAELLDELERLLAARRKGRA